MPGGPRESPGKASFQQHAIRWLESANGRVSERGLKGGTWDEHSANRATLLQGPHDFFKTLSIGWQSLHYLVMEQWPVIRLKLINPQHLC